MCEGGGGGGCVRVVRGASLIPTSLGLYVSSPVTMASVSYSRSTAYSESPPPKSSPAVHRKCRVCLPVVLTYCENKGGSDLGQLATRRPFFSARACLRLPRTSVGHGSTGWAALARPYLACFFTGRLHGEGVLEPRHGEASLSVDRVVRAAVVGQHLHVRSGERAVEWTLAGRRVSPIDAFPVLRVRAHGRSVRGVADVVGDVGG